MAEIATEQPKREGMEEEIQKLKNQGKKVFKIPFPKDAPILTAELISAIAKSCDQDHHICAIGGMITVITAGKCSYLGAKEDIK